MLAKNQTNFIYAPRKFNEKCPLIVSSRMNGTSCGEIAVGELDSDEKLYASKINQNIHK